MALDPNFEMAIPKTKSWLIMHHQNYLNEAAIFNIANKTSNHNKAVFLFDLIFRTIGILKNTIYYTKKITKNLPIINPLPVIKRFIRIEYTLCGCLDASTN